MLQWRNDSQACRAFENNVRDRIGAVHSKSICPIRRGGPMDAYRYLASSGKKKTNKKTKHEQTVKPGKTQLKTDSL